MPDLQIERLVLNIEDALGHEHRIQPIAMRASALLAELLQARLRGNRAVQSRQIASITAPALRLDLNATGDEQAARQIARAWLDALALHLRA